MTGLKKRGMLQGSALCKLCGEQDEDADHLFASCYVASILWQKVSSWCKIQQVFAFTMKDLLEFHKSSEIEVQKRDYVQTIFLATCWGIWKARNENIFRGKRVNIDAIFGEMQANSFLWIKCRAKKRLLEWSKWARFEL
ncbi:putative reverse transcriptase zinc-binding domain-containing protein [Helianthus annuus]|nr:putative reverse transcriptase zinc-binding domain-containing protein [Helianthus annuus]